jgi:hypothetical protein
VSLEGPIGVIIERGDDVLGERKGKCEMVNASV